MSKYNIGEMISDVKEVPEAWVYKFYYKKLTGNKINQPFDGRIIKVKSVVNRDSDPSLCFFYKEGKYYWKDFSSNIGGDFVKFVCYHLNKTTSVAMTSICWEYERFLGTSEDNFTRDDIDEQLIVKPTYEIKTTNYYSEDFLVYWRPFKIPVDTLTEYNVDPGLSYRIKKGTRVWDFQGRFFAFCNQDGCYQIYQPAGKPKYINIDTKYLIGKEQLNKKNKVCAVVSGLKDIMAMRQLNLSINYVAGSSESTLIGKYDMEWLKSEHEFVISMMDNDVTGVKSMLRYKNVYGLPYVHIRLAKDHAENNRHYNLLELTQIYGAEINKKLKI